MGSTMVVWTLLANVEECHIVGKTSFFSPLLVFVGNYLARNKFPSKFVYALCPTRLENGWVCGKSLGKFDPKCDHGRQPTLSYRFQLIMFNAIHGRVAPVRAQLWENTSIFLGYLAVDFNALSTVE